MLSKEDYRKYSYQMLDVEQKMCDLYKQYADETGDAEIKKIFKDLCNDEMLHCSLVENVIRMIIN